MTVTFPPKAIQFLSDFVADINGLVKTGMPQSQLVQQTAEIGFDRTNLDVPGVVLLNYVGGTIACEDLGQGLEPQPVESAEAFFGLYDIQMSYLKDVYPNTEFRWNPIPPPLDSGTMDEIKRVHVVAETGKSVDKAICNGDNVIGVAEIHGTDSAIKSLSRLAEAFPTSPVPIAMITAQDPPGTHRGDGRSNILDTIELMHAKITGHFAVAANEVYIPVDSIKASDHAHRIYGAGPYGYGHYATMDASKMTIHRALTKQSSGDRSMMPWFNERFIHHYRNIDTRAKTWRGKSTATCLEIPADATRDAVFNATRAIHDDGTNYRYAMVGSLGASNVNDARRDFLKAASEEGICSVVVSEVKGATDISPYAAGANQTEHVTVSSPDSVFSHMTGKFYFAAALTDYVLEARGVAEKDAGKIRPLLFRELYNRERGYDEAFIPGGGRSNASIKDYGLQLWMRSQAGGPA